MLMAVIGLHAERSYGPDEIRSRTAFSWRERPLVDASFKVSAHLQSHGFTAMLIGGAAARFYTDSSATGRVAHPELTDLDFVIREIPIPMVSHVKKSHILGRSRTAFPASGEPVSRFEELDYPLYRLTENGTTIPGIRLDHVDLFHERICETIVLPADFNQAQRIQLQDGSSTFVLALADPGFLLASMVDPQSVTDRRLKRMAFMLASMRKDNEALLAIAAHRYVEVMQRNSNFSVDDITRLFRHFLHMAHNAPPSAQFVEIALGDLKSG